MNTQAESLLTARASIGSKKRGYRKEITGCSALFVHARRLSIPAFASASKRKTQANIGKKSKDGSDERISSLPHRGALAKTQKNGNFNRGIEFCLSAIVRAITAAPFTFPVGGGTILIQKNPLAGHIL